MQVEKTNLEQRNILFSEFLDARSLEISKMDGILAEKMLASTKLAFQLLPKHMRRRPMSHNKYRIPSRIRAKVPEIPQKKRNHCRKHLRKARLLTLRYKQRDSKCKWLENHIFQAKRMKMIEYFGYKIPLYPNNKSERACYRFFNHDAVMYDLSYYLIFEFQATEEILRRSFEKVLENKDFLNIFRENSIKGLRTGNIQVWKDKEKGDLIGPVEFFFKPYEEKDDLKKKLWILGHPGLKEEIMDLFKKEEELEVKLIENSMNIFHVFGPKSLGRVFEAITKAGFVEEKSENLVKYFKIITDPSIYPKGSLLHLSFEKILGGKKLLQGKRELLTNKNQNVETYEKVKVEEINKAIIEIAKYIPLENKFSFSEEKSVWDIKEHLQYEKRFKNIVRGRFTHKKSNQQPIKIPEKLPRKERMLEKKLKKALLKEKPIDSSDLNKELEENKLENRESDLKITKKDKKKAKLAEKLEKKLGQTLLKQNPTNCNSNMEIEPKIEMKPMEPENFKESPFLNLMLSFDSHISPPGLKIFAPMGSGLELWRLLHFSNIKILGLREYENILHEKKNVVFPSDYPLTKTCSTLSEVKKKELVLKYFKRPPKNRLNYQRIGFPYPFQSDFSILGSFYRDLMPIQIIMIGKGVPKEKAIICLLKKEDLELVGKILKNPKENSGIVYREKLKVRSLGDLKKIDENKINEECRKISTEREIIGFLTYGDFSKSAARGVGIGFAKQGFLKENEVFGLIRNPNSRYYYLCEIKKLFSK